MSTTPASSPDLGKSDEPTVTAATATRPLPAKPAQANAARTPQQSPPAPPADEGDYEEPSHFGRFVLFNVVPSSIVSGVVHFVGFLVLALLTIPPPTKSETLAIHTPPAAEKVEELQEETLDLKLDSVLSDQATDVVQQVL